MKSLISGLCILLILIAFPANAKKKECECEFSKDPWEAYGTNAGCVTYSRKNKTSCEVEFAGLSYDSNLLKEVLELDPQEYRKKVFEVVGEYIEALRINDIKHLTSAGFLRKTLPIFMRGAYLRTPINQQIDKKWAEDLKNLDNIITSFFNNESDIISSVFRGSYKTESFEKEHEGAYFYIGRGYVIVEFEGAILNAILIPGE